MPPPGRRPATARVRQRLVVGSDGQRMPSATDTAGRLVRRSRFGSRPVSRPKTAGLLLRESPHRFDKCSPVVVEHAFQRTALGGRISKPLAASHVEERESNDESGHGGIGP